MSGKSFEMDSYCHSIEDLDACMDDYLYAYDMELDDYCISPSATERFGIKENRFHNVQEQLAQIVYPEDMAMLTEDLAMVQRGEKEFHNLQYRWLSARKEIVWINCRGRVIHGGDGSPRYLIGCINEIGQKQKADNISGLLGEEGLRCFLEEHPLAGKKGFLLRIGIDNLKDINANHGIESGDEVLRRTVEAVRSVMQQSQYLYRMVSDEFILLDMGGSTAMEAAQYYRRIRRRIDLLTAEHQYDMVYTISGGVLGLSEIVEYSFSHMMKLTEYALGRAKDGGRNQCYVYQPEDYNQYLRGKQLECRMRRAVRQDFHGFEAYFQPIVDGRSHKLYMAETLMRFTTDEGRAVSPVEFIPILEDTGLIIPLGKWILRQALGLCKEVHKINPDFKVTVNLSYVQVLKSDVLLDIVSGIREFGLSPDNLVVEITESGLLEENPNLRRFCRGLHNYGIQLALDDFGTGYSNFHYLHNLRPSLIKIDRSFTASALQNEYEYGLLQQMIDMAHNIDMRLCTEGIETTEELESIVRLEPDFIQGYYFGRPCPAKELLSRYAEGSAS